MNVLVLGHMQELQTGMYIVESIEEVGHTVNFVDTRAAVNAVGVLEGQNLILKQLTELNVNPDIIIVLKGLEMTIETLTLIKKKYSNAKLVNWFFDVYLADKKIWENEKFFEAIRLYDYFMCSLKGVADNLRIRGFDNAIHIGEACYPLLHGECHVNNFQKGKYGSDVAFIGSIGIQGIHKNRVEFLNKIADAGFDLKVWGRTIGEAKSIPLTLRQHMTNTPVINEQHSQVCQSSLINLGIDQDPTIDESWSARLYRIMCAGGLYLSTPTRGISKYFKINGVNEEITSDQDLVVFYSDVDLIKKIDFLLEHNDIRESIAKNGQKKVVEGHTFAHKIKEIIEVCKK